MRYSLSGNVDSIRNERSDAVTIITEDGYVGCIYHNGKWIEAVLYYDRWLRFEFDDKTWDEVSERKFYIKTFDSVERVNDTVIMFCLEYLCLFCPTYEFVEWNTLVVEYNNQRELEDSIDDLYNCYKNHTRECDFVKYVVFTDQEKMQILQYIEGRHLYDYDDKEREYELFQILKYLNQ